MFTAPIMTALRFVNFRLPFTSFRYSTGGQGPAKLDPSRLVKLSVRSVLCHWQCPLAAKSMQRGRQFVGACLFHLQSCFGADIAGIRRWRALSEILNRCRYDCRPAKLSSVVKPGDLGLMFSDSRAKDFTIEIDRVKASLLSASTAVILPCMLQTGFRNPGCSLAGCHWRGRDAAWIGRLFCKKGTGVNGWKLLLQAMPTGEETDFILVSCAGALVADDEPATAAAVLSHKRKAEQALRHSGLGYTIMPPRAPAGGAWRLQGPRL